MEPYEAIVEFPVATTHAIPITTQEPTMSDFDPNDAGAVSRFFQSLADKVVLASTLPKEVEELRAAIEQLRNDVEIYRSTNARLDEEVSRLRQERVDLQRENATLRETIGQQEVKIVNLERLVHEVSEARNRWHNDYGNVSEVLVQTRRERDDAQMKVLELEDALTNARRDCEQWRDTASRTQDRLDSIRSALAA